MTRRQSPATRTLHVVSAPCARKGSSATGAWMNGRLIDGWLSWLASGSTAASTIRQRRYTIEAFARGHDLTVATTQDVEQYLGDARRGPEGRKTVLATLRGFYRWGILHGYLTTDPTSFARGIRVPPGVPKPTPEGILSRALMRSDVQTRFMLTLGAYAGLRRSEIAGLHSDDVTGAGLRITGKGGRVRMVPIHPNLQPYLGFTGWAFPSPVRLGLHAGPDYVASHVEDALGGGWTTHSLRHRFATQSYRATHDLRSVQQLLGHTSPTTTARYVLVDEDALAAAVLAVA